MEFAEIEAFAEECAAIDETLAEVEADAWSRPALGSWNLAELVTHMIRGATRITEYLPLPVDDQPLIDRIEYWRYDAEAQGPAIAKRAVEEAAKHEPAELPGHFAGAWRASVAAANDHGASQTLPTIMGPMRLDEYTATRVLEMVIHHLDVRIALDLPPVATPAAARMTMAVLEALLGEPRPRNMGRTRFLLAATGRQETDDPRFPVLR